MRVRVCVCERVRVRRKMGFIRVVVEIRVWDVRVVWWWSWLDILERFVPRECLGWSVVSWMEGIGKGKVQGKYIKMGQLPKGSLFLHIKTSQTYQRFHSSILSFLLSLFFLFFSFLPTHIIIYRFRNEIFKPNKSISLHLFNHPFFFFSTDSRPRPPFFPLWRLFILAWQSLPSISAIPFWQHQPWKQSTDWKN